MGDLNRQQRRKMEREQEKARKSIESFSPKQLELIDKIIEGAISERVNELDELYLVSLNALFVEYMPNETNEDIEFIKDRFKEICLEHARKTKKLIEGESEEMAKGKIESLKAKIEKKAKFLINQGMKQKEIIETLKDNFPEASSAMINNIYKGIKAVVEAHEDDGEGALEYIFADKTELNKVEAIYTKEDEKREETFKLAEKILKEDKEEIKKICEVQKMGSNLKVLKKVVILEVEGKHGSYKFQDGKVEVSPNVEAIPKDKFNSIDEVKEYKREHLELIKSKYEEIEEVFGMV